jgi:hypothetical protein
LSGMNGFDSSVEAMTYSLHSLSRLRGGGLSLRCEIPGSRFQRGPE